MEPKNQIGKRIRTARESKGLTQKEVAKKVGVTDAYISRLERNDARPSDDLCKELAKVLDLNERELRKRALEERSSIDIDKELLPLERPTSSELDKDKKEVVEYLRNYLNGQEE